MALMAAPPAASMTVAGRQARCDRSAAPASEASNCPASATRKTTTMATSACRDRICVRAWAIPRGDHRTGRRTAQEPNDAQRANDETLPVTLHGERGREYDQDHIEQVTRHTLTV